jgi:regulator of RNase E activity RraA
VTGQQAVGGVEVEAFDHAVADPDGTLPSASAAAKAATTSRARATSSGEGEKAALAASIWAGWIRLLPSKPKARP